MRTGRFAVTTHIADELTSVDPIPHLQAGSKRIPHVTIFGATASLTIRVVNHNPLPIPLGGTDILHRTASAGVKGRAVRCAEIQPTMMSAPAGPKTTSQGVRILKHWPLSDHNYPSLNKKYCPHIQPGAPGKLRICDTTGGAPWWGLVGIKTGAAR